MLLGSIQMYGEKLSSLEVRDICKSLNTNDIRLLSLREVAMNDADFEELTRSVGECRSILQLNLNLGMLSSSERSWRLAGALNRNRSLTSLFLHGSTVGERGMCMVLEALGSHPNIVSLDVGDCLLGDKVLNLVSKLLPPKGAKRALQELVLSANPDITSVGWTKFFVAMAADNSLRNLSLDYNKIGDYGVGCLSVALASCKTLQTLDLEGCGIKDGGAEVLLHMASNYPVSLKQVVLAENKISLDTIKTIDACLEDKDGKSESEFSETTTDSESCLSDAGNYRKSRARKSDTTTDSYASETESETESDDSSCTSVEELKPVEMVGSGFQKRCP